MPETIFSQTYAGVTNIVAVYDEPTEGGGCHVYEAECLNAPSLKESTESESVVIEFQKGAIQEHGINGIQNEQLLAMVEHRLQGFQSGPYSCRENAIALTKIQEALMWLERRTKDRAARGVEGKNEA